MMGKYINTDSLGSVQISDDVISALVSLSVSDVEGVVSIGAKPSTLDIKDILSKKGFGKNVRTELKDNALNIDVDITVNYGTSVNDIAEKVQSVVRDAVVDATGLDVNAVSVHVCGIVFPKPKEK